MKNYLKKHLIISVFEKFSDFTERNDTMKIEKLPSGSYRIRKMYRGTTYTVITDYKPTQKEAMQLMAEELNAVQEKKTFQTFKSAAEEYIEERASILSPSTVSSYKGLIRNLSDSFNSTRLSDMTATDVQVEMNRYNVNHSPKSVRDMHGFISAVLRINRPGLVLSTTLPKPEKKKEYIPTDADVKAILTHFKDTEFEIPLLLATFGLRRSEICALTIDDLNGNTLTINKAFVKGPDKKFVLKATKTTDGTRDIYIPDYLVALIRNQGYIYKGNPDKILVRLHKAQKELGIPSFRLHALRHYYASMAHSLGIPDAYIMEAGGWKSDRTLKTVYRHALDDKIKEMQQSAAAHINQLIDTNS